MHLYVGGDLRPQRDAYFGVKINATSTHYTREIPGTYATGLHGADHTCVPSCSIVLILGLAGTDLQNIRFSICSGAYPITGIKPTLAFDALVL